jgi:hypothetical protein
MLSTKHLFIEIHLLQTQCHILLPTAFIEIAFRYQSSLLLYFSRYLNPVVATDQSLTLAIKNGDLLLYWRD